MSTAGNQSAAGRCPGWVRFLLVLSLAANLAVAGIVIGHQIRAGQIRAEKTSDRRGADRVTAWIIDMVPEERQEFARKHFSDLPNRLESEHAERMALLPQVVAAMEAEPFDPEALDKALAAMSKRRDDERIPLRQSLISLLAALTPAERVSFAQNFQAKLDARGGKSGR